MQGDYFGRNRFTRKIEFCFVRTPLTASVTWSTIVMDDCLGMYASMWAVEILSIIRLCLSSWLLPRLPSLLNSVHFLGRVPLLDGHCYCYKDIAIHTIIFVKLSFILKNEIDRKKGKSLNLLNIIPILDIIYQRKEKLTNSLNYITNNLVPLQKYSKIH